MAQRANYSMECVPGVNSNILEAFGMDAEYQDPSVCHRPLITELQKIIEDSKLQEDLKPMQEPLKIDVKDSPGATVAKEIHYHSHADTRPYPLENIEARTKETLDDFNTEAVFVTRAGKRATDRLQYHGYVCLEGKDKSGKSTLGMYLLKSFSKKSFLPLILNNPEEFPYVSMKEQYVIFIDDIFGPKELSKGLVTRWTKVLEVIFQRVKSGNVYLIIASKDGFIDKSQQWINLDEFFDKAKRVRLQDSDLTLRDYEKVSILEKIAKHLRFPKNNKILVKTASLSQNSWFFACCKHVRRYRLHSNEWPDFFKHPIPILYQEIAKLKNTYPVKLATLFLLIKSGVLFGTETKIIPDEELELMSEILSLPRHPSISDIRDAAFSMDGEFLSCTDGKCTFLHRTVKDTVCFVLWEAAPVYSLRWFPTEFLINHTTTDHVKENSLQNLRIDKDLFVELRNRMWKSYNIHVLKHTAFKDKDFVKLFLANNPHVSEEVTVGAMLCMSTVCGHLCLLREILDIWSKFPTSVKDVVEQFAIEIACLEGHVNIVETLLQAGVRPSKSCAISAIRSGHADEILPRFPKNMVSSIAEEVKVASLTWLITSDSTKSVKLWLDNMTDKKSLQGLVINGMLIASEKGNFDMYSTFEQALTEEINYDVILPLAIQGGNILLMYHLMGKLNHKAIANVQAFLLACSHNRKEIAKLIWDESNGYTRSEIFGHIGSDFTALQKASTATEKGDLELLTWLLDEGFPVNEKGSLGQTPLHTACNCGNVEAVKKLLAKGSDVAMVDDEENTALHLQCSSDQPDKDLVEILLNTNANICVLNKDNKTPLHILCEKQHEARSTVMHYLIGNKAPINSLDSKGHTPLYLLLDRGFCLEEIELLLENGASVDVKDNMEETPLHAVCRNHNSKALQMIVERKADLAATDKTGATCLHHAVTAINNGEVVRYLLEKGIYDLNMPDIKGNTALHAAVRIPFSEAVVALLLENGADPILTNKDGYTPFHIACQESNESSLCYLNAMLKIKPTAIASKNEHSPLHLVCTSNNKHASRIVERLLDEGVGINNQDKSGKTALHLVCETLKKTSFHIGQELCAREADLDCTDSDGNTPLHLALYSDGDYKDNMIHLLVKQGANVTLRNQKNVSPVMIVQEQGNADILSCMIDNILNQACMAKGNYTAHDVDEALVMEKQLSTLYENCMPLLHRICSVHGENSPIIVVKVLEHGADITAKGTDGMTAIHSACLAIGPCTESLLTTLIEWNVDIMAVDKQGQTALHKAIQSDNCHTQRVLEQLIKSGLHPNIPDRNGDTPLHLVCESSGANTRSRIHWLLQNGADWKYRNNKGETPYDRASKSLETKRALLNEILLKYCENTEILESGEITDLLLEGANINCRNKEGNTILHLMILGGRRRRIKDNIELMISLGADVDIHNQDDKTPYEVALYRDMYEDVLRLLYPQPKSLTNVASQGKCSKITENSDEDVLGDLVNKAVTLKDATVELVGSAYAVAKRVKKLLD